MSISTLAILGTGAGILNIAAFAPYIRSIRWGQTKPERSSWWIWTLLMLGAFAAQADAGATWSLILTGTLLVGNLTIALYSLRYGYGRFKPRDFLALLVAALGVILWRATDNPLAALIVIVGVDFLGSWLTFAKSWRAPYSEILSTWVLMAAAAVLATLAVGRWDPTTLIFPLYLAVVNALTIWDILYRRNWRKQRILLGRHIHKSSLRR